MKKIMRRCYKTVQIFLVWILFMVSLLVWYPFMLLLTIGFWIGDDTHFSDWHKLMISGLREFWEDIYDYLKDEPK